MRRPVALQIERLEPRLVLSTTPLITEFMASNNSTLADGDSAFSDWIEVHNPTAMAIDLAGWHLTDDGANLGKWEFPSLPASVLDPGEYLVVFASGQITDTYVDPAGNLHTNFRVGADGEYLALTDASETIISEFAPTFPPQETDISYGVGVTQQDPLVAVGDMADILVPTSAGELPADWATINFVPGVNWISGPTGIGYDTGSSATIVASYDASLGGAGVAPDPTTQGWISDHTGGPPNQQVFDASPDLGLDAWAIIDQGGGGRLEYEFDLTNQQIADGHANGWSLTSNSRTIDGEFDVLVYRDGVRQYLVWKEIDSNGDMVVDLLGDTSYTLTTDGTGADAYHDHDLTYDPGTGLATYWFDGAAISTWNGGAHSGKQILWGSGSTGGQGEAHYHNVTHSIGSLGDFVPHIETNLEAQIAGVNASAFVRLPFSVTDPNDYDTLTLDMQYDDGFAAYLNGTLVTSRNASASLVFDSAATATRDDADAAQFESFDLSAHLGLLQSGANVLAIQALNASVGDDDLLLTPRLSAFDSTAENLLYFTSPTPGAANGSGFLGFVGDTTFSIDRGFFSAPFDVEISTALAGANIYYTTDGSAPSETNGTLYTGAVNISTTTALRAMATLDGFLPTNVDTHSYFFLSDVLTEDGAGLPAPPFPSTSNWDYEMDPNIVNDSRFSSLQSDLQTLPTLSLVMDEDDAWGTSGFYATLTESQAAERPVSVELIGTDGVGLFQEDAGIRVFGSGSLNRALGKKSMRLVFRSNFGPTKLNYPFFGPDRAGEINTIAIRGNYFDTWTFQSDGGGLGDGCCGRSRSTFLRDQFAHETHDAMGAHAIAGNFVHLYINGIYWGLYNPTERPDEEFMQSYFGGADTDYDVIKTGVDVVSGDLVGWNEMFTIARGNGPNGSLANDAAYDDLKQYLDMDEFIDYLLVNFYGGNHDWPHNNWYVARNRAAGEPFRFYEWDAENFLFSVSSNRTGVNNSNTPGELYNRLRQNDEFNLRFADRAQKHMFNDGAITVAEATARFQNIVDTIRPALNAESARWGDELQEPAHNSFDDFDAVVDEKLNNYFPVRTGIVLGQLVSAGLFPGTEAPAFNQHGGQVASGFDLTMSAPNGTLYYTLDGSDPREVGGAIGASAMEFAGAAIDITTATTVRARALNGGEWSALTEAAFNVVPFADASNLRLTELHYNPAAPTATEISAGFTDNDEFEFVELLNTSAESI
ncbi:MAG: CotH kinase family protein, partial [Aeoliella sp.]